MGLSELLKKGKIKKTDYVKEQAENLLKIAKRDISSAELLLGQNLDGSFMLSYNSILQSSRALMAISGYRAVDEEHKTPLEFASIALPGFHEADFFDRLRKKRHEATYESAGVITEYQARHALQTAKNFYSAVLAKIPQSK